MKKSLSPKIFNKEIFTDHTGLERLVFFNDAVFAIAITLLALDIRLPENLSITGEGDLLSALLALRPKYMGFMISFLVIGAFWSSHHRLFRKISRYDGRLLFMNLVLLMLICFVPFPTGILSEYGNQVATIFYALTMACIGLLMLIIWLYASRNARLLDEPVPPDIQRRVIIRLAITPLVFLISIGIAFLNADAAKYFWLVMLLDTFVK